MLYVPLLPDVTAGVLAPRRVAVPLRAHLPRTRLVLGTVTSLDLDERACSVVDVEGRSQVVRYDRLVITCGSVTRLLAVPGVAEHALGFKSIAEALYLRDHILQQLELAEQCDDDDERAARLTFVVVGAGYTGTEVAAQGALLTQRALRHRPAAAVPVAGPVELALSRTLLAGMSRGALAKPTATSLNRPTHLGITVMRMKLAALGNERLPMPADSPTGPSAAAAGTGAPWRRRRAIGLTGRKGARWRARSGPGC